MDIKRKGKTIYDVYEDAASDKKNILAQYDEKPDREVILPQQRNLFLPIQSFRPRELF